MVNKSEFQNARSNFLFFMALTAIIINSGVRPLPLGMGIQAANLGLDICEFFKNNRKDA